MPPPVGCALSGNSEQVRLEGRLPRVETVRMPPDLNKRLLCDVFCDCRSRDATREGEDAFTRQARLIRRYGAGVRPWRRMISAIFARSGGPPAAALITSADSRKYCGPIAAGVITQSAFTSWLPLLSNR